MADPLAFVGLRSLLDARSHFLRQTWALAFHRGTMKVHPHRSRENAPTMLGPSAIALAIQMGLSERLGGRGGRAIASCDRGSGQDGFCRWVEGTGPRLPCLGAERSNRSRIYCKLIEQMLGARWTMNASRLRSNKELSSELQEINGF